MIAFLVISFFDYICLMEKSIRKIKVILKKEKDPERIKKLKDKIKILERNKTVTK